MPDSPVLLFVDDEPDLLEMLKNLLEPEGYRCLLASSGRQALAFLEQETVDLVLTDMHMAEMNGLQLLEQVSKRWPDIIRMVLSGYADKDSVIDAINLGNIQAYFEKPFQSASLFREVKDAIRGKRLREEEIRQTEEHVHLVEAQRQRTLELFYAITNTAHDAILMMDDQGKITYWNRQAEIMFGYPMVEALGKELHSLFVPKRYTMKYLQGLEHFTKTGQGPLINNVKEFNALRRDGTEFPVELSVSAIKSDDAWHALGMVRDITERIKAEAVIKKSRENLRNLATRLNSAREEERTAIARDIHDVLGQSLTALKMDLSWLSERMPRNWKVLPDKIKTMNSLLGNTIDFVRRLSSSLRPVMIDDLGLEAAIEWQLQGFEARTGCKVTLDVDETTLVTRSDRDIIIFRIFQEALTNVGRHAKASQVEVSLHHADSLLQLTVKDNGTGIEEWQKTGNQSLGLMGMSERANGLGGQFRIEALEAGGTLVTLSVPLPEMPA